jgi:hypothetical protein
MLFPAMTCAAFTEKCFNNPPLFSRSFNFLNPRAAVRNLKIPPLYYEILVVGSDQKIDDGIRPLQCTTVTHRMCAHAMFTAPQPVALHTVCMPMPCSNPLQAPTCAISVVSANSLTKSAPRLRSRLWRWCEFNIYEIMCFFRAYELRDCVLWGSCFESLKARLATSRHPLTRAHRYLSHDYITVRGDFYVGMRSYGRDWQNMQPGAFYSDTGQILSVNPCPPGSCGVSFK